MSTPSSDRTRAREPTVFRQPTELENEATRLFHAPRHRVFQFFTDAQTLAHGFSADPSRVTIEEFDFRVGGRFVIAVRQSDGSTVRFSGEYLEIDPPRRMVNTFVASAQPGLSSVETDEFEEVGSFTRLTVRWKFARREDRDAMYGPELERGVSASFDHVADLLGSP